MSKTHLLEILGSDPLKALQTWLDEAKKTSLKYPHAMSLCTVSEEKIPDNRIVLLKKFTGKSIIFFTNYNSKKASHIEQNPIVSLLLHWDELGRQIVIQGEAKKISFEESANYFETRPRESQIGAWASKQSQVLKDPDELSDSCKKYDEKFKNQSVPLPEFWGGYSIEPTLIEFWQAQEFRLNERVLFFKSDNETWEHNLLFP